MAPTGSGSKVSKAPIRTPNPAERVQTGVRLEKRLVKVLKALAEFYDLSLGDLLEELALGAFAGRKPFSDTALARIAELMRFYGLELAPPRLPVEKED